MLTDFLSFGMLKALFPQRMSGDNSNPFGSSLARLNGDILADERLDSWKQAYTQFAFALLT